MYRIWYGAFYFQLIWVNKLCGRKIFPPWKIILWYEHLCRESSWFIENDSYMIHLSVLFIWSLFSLIDSALCYVVDALIIIVLPTSSQSVIFVGPPYCSHRVDKRSALKHKQRKVNYYWCQVVGVQPFQIF